MCGWTRGKGRMGNMKKKYRYFSEKMGRGRNGKDGIKKEIREQWPV